MPPSMWTTDGILRYTTNVLAICFMLNMPELMAARADTYGMRNAVTQQLIRTLVFGRTTMVVFYLYTKLLAIIFFTKVT
jgi:hypothetical protein